MKKTVIYARYSCSSQTEQSIEGQLDVCNKFAKANDLEIVKVYVDRAMTGTNDNRPDFQQMIKDSEKASWEVVLVYAIDRFGRNAVEVAINRQKLKKNGKVLISATQRMSDNIDGTKNLDGILLENVYIGIAEYYSAELAQKVRRGRNETLKKGLYCGGSIAFGYRLKDKKLIIDEKEAKIIKFIYDQYFWGETIKEIQDELVAQGIYYKGKPFKLDFINRILNNTNYTGISKIGDNVYDKVYPQIIDKRLFDAVHNLLAEHKCGKGTDSNPFWFKNKIYCGYCGCNISGESGKSRTGKRYYYYKCNGKKKHHNGCEKQQVRKDDLEDILLRAILRCLKHQPTFDLMIDDLMTLQEDEIKNNSRLANLRESKERIEKSIANILNAIESGVVSNAATKRLEALEKEQEQILKEIAIEEANLPLLLTREEIKQYYLDCLQRKPKALIDVLIKKVILYDDRAEIYYNNPTCSKGDHKDFILYKKTSDVDTIKMGRGPIKTDKFSVNIHI